MEELNTNLFNEIVLSKKNDKLTDNLIMLIVDLVKSEIQTDRFKFIPKKYYDSCCAYTYSSVSKHILKFNPDRTDNAVPYVKIMIRCAFANWIGRNWEMLGYKKKVRK